MNVAASASFRTPGARIFGIAAGREDGIAGFANPDRWHVHTQECGGRSREDAREDGILYRLPIGGRESRNGDVGARFRVRPDLARVKRRPRQDAGGGHVETRVQLALATVHSSRFDGRLQIPPESHVGHERPLFGALAIMRRAFVASLGFFRPYRGAELGFDGRKLAAQGIDFRPFFGGQCLPAGKLVQALADLARAQLQFLTSQHDLSPGLYRASTRRFQAILCGDGDLRFCPAVISTWQPRHKVLRFPSSNWAPPLDTGTI